MKKTTILNTSKVGEGIITHGAHGGLNFSSAESAGKCHHRACVAWKLHGKCHAAGDSSAEVIFFSSFSKTRPSCLQTKDYTQYYTYYTSTTVQHIHIMYVVLKSRKFKYITNCFKSSEKIFFFFFFFFFYKAVFFFYPQQK
uniref:Uncharacterized protein n=1 Tax=Cacopsylla melanoneura TaxID=428564 RepID=A0A8D9BV12_9HEMI